MYAAALPFQGPWIISLIHAAKGVYFQPKPPATPYYTRYSMHHAPTMCRQCHLQQFHSIQLSCLWIIAWIL